MVNALAPRKRFLRFWESGRLLNCRSELRNYQEDNVNRFSLKSAGTLVLLGAVAAMTSPRKTLTTLASLISRTVIAPKAWLSCNAMATPARLALEVRELWPGALRCAGTLCLSMRGNEPNAAIHSFRPRVRDYITTGPGRPHSRTCPSDRSRREARGARAHVRPVGRCACPGSC
jgi:hypothetical protein